MLVESRRRRAMATESHNRSTNPSDRHRIPALVVGSWQGDVGVVQAQTGARLWHQQTGRKLATLAQDGARYYLAPGVSHALQRQAQHLRGDRTRAHLRQRLQEQAAAPTALTGRRLEDGSLVWTYTDWSLTGPLRLAVDVHTFISKPPVLDAAENWIYDSNADCYTIEPTQTPRTKKVFRIKPVWSSRVQGMV
jgi:hypothetical protein